MAKSEPAKIKKTRALPENTVTLGCARFSVLTPSLIRLEYAPDKKFEDRASFFALHRGGVKQDFKAWVGKGRVQIETSALRLDWRDHGRPFGADNLSIVVLPSGTFPGAAWKPGLEEKGNLGGTLRTLDECKGPLDLGQGILSRDGWHLQDDSAKVLFTDSPKPWVAARRKSKALDWYFFGYGHDYARGLQDMARLGGAIPLPPRYVLGSWYSRFWPYKSQEFLDIADEYRDKGFPLDVMVVDMDWHEKGWTGYTWNKELIPDPEGLLKGLHKKGLHVTLNLHPHDGVQAHEAAYGRFAKAMGKNPKAKKAVPFDVTSPAFMENYFRLLLNPMEKQGVDFWWMDWQQGTKTRIEGLDPLMWLNHLHFQDRQKSKKALRGLNFSRWAGLGDHRHPVQFSGDTHASWEVLKFLIPFTSRAGNVGACWWSHDLGGHFIPKEGINPELYLRWLQFGALSPVMRIHSSLDKANDRRPWVFGEDFERMAREAYLLRARLLPYLYTAARQAHDLALPLCRPMYLHYPGEALAYESDGQYLLGEDLLVAPVTQAAAQPGGKAKVKVWFPKGEWYHLQSHQKVQGPCELEIEAGLDYMPVFARGGAPIPLAPQGHLRASEAPKELVLRVYPGPECTRELYEDAGEGQGYQRGEFRRSMFKSFKGPQGMGIRMLGTFGSLKGDAPRFAVETPVGKEKVLAARS